MKLSNLFNRALAVGLVEKKGPWIYLPDDSKCQGNKQFETWCKEHPVFSQEVSAKEMANKAEPDVAREEGIDTNTKKDPKSKGFERLRQALRLFVAEPKYQAEMWLLEEYPKELIIRKGAHSQLAAARFRQIDGGDFWPNIMLGTLKRKLVREFAPTREVLELSRRLKNPHRSS